MEREILKKLIKNDPILQEISSQISLPVIESTHNVFHDLMSCIIEQQIHYRSTKKIFQKMLEVSTIEILSLSNYEQFEKKAFENKKLSAKKYETIVRIVEFFGENQTDWQELEEEEVRKALSSIKGVGTWTIDMILMYTLQKPNIFPADDYHLRLIMTKLYNIDVSARIKAQQKQIAENWSPYKSYGVQYLLAWKDFLKKGIP